MNQAPVICMPVYRQIEVETMVSVIKTQAEAMVQYNDAIMSRTRARLVYRFLTETQADVMVFIDGDMVFSPEAFNDLVSLCQQKKTIVGACYATRGQGKMALTLDGPIDIGPDTEPAEVKTIGTGFMAIPRSVLERMVKDKTLITKNTDVPFWPLFEHFVVGEEFFSEDTSFCMRAKTAGVKIWAMTHHQIGHLGSHTFYINQGRYG